MKIMLKRMITTIVVSTVLFTSMSLHAAAPAPEYFQEGSPETAQLGQFVNTMFTTLDELFKNGAIEGGKELTLVYKPLAQKYTAVLKTAIQATSELNNIYTQAGIVHAPHGVEYANGKKALVEQFFFCFVSAAKQICSINEQIKTLFSQEESCRECVAAFDTALTADGNYKDCFDPASQIRYIQALQSECSEAEAIDPSTMTLLTPLASQAASADDAGVLAQKWKLIEKKVQELDTAIAALKEEQRESCFSIVFSNRVLTTMLFMEFILMLMAVLDDNPVAKDCLWHPVSLTNATAVLVPAAGVESLYQLGRWTKRKIKPVIAEGARRLGAKAKKMFGRRGHGGR